MNEALLEQAKALSLEDRIELTHSLWENILSAGYEPELTEEQAAELDRRVQEHRDRPEEVIPWSEIKAVLDARHSRPR